MNFLVSMGDALWNPWLLGAVLAVGGYFSLRTGFFQLFHIRSWLCTSCRGMLRKGAGKSGVTQLQAMSTALAATIGTGSIAGVATAIFFGGPGAVFWMWISAVLGMMTSFAEKSLAIKYRRRNGCGWSGGPMCYMEDGLGMKGMACFYSAALVVQTLSGGAMVQANSIASALNAAFGWNRAIVGMVIALAVGIVILGGIRRIGTVSECMVPVMGLLFVGGGVAVLIVNRHAIPDALNDIIRYAFQPKSVLGGYSASTALRYGVARGVFTNEAGMGSSAIAHAAAEHSDPAEQGMGGIFEVFVATLVICTISALAILTSGLYTVQGALHTLETGKLSDRAVGAPLTAASFAAVLGKHGFTLVSVCSVMFAFTSLLGMEFYGQRGVETLTAGKTAMRVYQIVYLLSIIGGSIGAVTNVWGIADLCNGLLALPNLVALVLLSPEVMRIFKVYMHEKAIVKNVTKVSKNK